MPKLGSRIKAGFGRTIREYAETSTTHGISYVFEDGQPRFERALWLILTATCVVLAITLSVLAYQDWQDNPVVTYVSTTALPIENISFPSVTICGQGLIQEVVSTAIMKKFGYFVESKGKVLADLTSTSKADLYDQYLKEKYNGLDPKDIIFSMALPDPDNAVASSVISGQVQEPVSGQLGYCLIITASDNPDEECEVDDTTSFPQPSQLFKAKEMENFGTHSHIGTYYSDTEKGDKLDVFGYFSLHEGHETSINPLIEVTKSEEIQSLLSKMPCQNARKNTFACFVDEDFQAELKNPIKAKKTEERIPPRVDKLLNQRARPNWPPTLT
ncbi:uncharacterized protein LOC131882017 [Tigriopus californicus]|uniref:uncharacterized protein LOC131882017 n=1 Tax=Tigriopus californicus TaxID=6832 RepID=UPI0027DA95CC|nr:uncharacterized protein LOC131882017 [Tigriopus californicus]